METFEPWNPARAQEIIVRGQSREGPLLPILHGLQAAFGCVPRDAIPLVAKALNLGRAEVHGVVSFYHDFRSERPARRVVKLCRAEACQAVGGEEAARFLLAALGLPARGTWGGVTDDGSVSVEAIYCLGLCAVAPGALIDGQPIGRFDGMTLAEAVRR